MRNYALQNQKKDIVRNCVTTRATRKVVVAAAARDRVIDVLRQERTHAWALPRLAGDAEQELSQRERPSRRWFRATSWCFWKPCKTTAFAKISCLVSLFMVFSLVGETMQIMKKRGEATFIPASDWIRQVGRETGAFDVTSVVEGKSEKRDSAWDFIITLSVPPDSRRVHLFVLTRSALSPQAALLAFDKFKWVPPDGVLTICAPYIPPRVTELCRDHHVSYFDGVGNCRIAAPGLFVLVSGRPNRQATIKTAIDPFSRKSSRIVRTLLKHPARGWQVQQLAQEAAVSLGLASRVKQSLIDEAYLEARDRLLYLRDPAKLLQAWAVQYRPHVKRLPLFTLSRPPEAERRLAEWCRANEVRYALTQLAAAWRYLPLVRYDKSVAYIDKKVASEAHLTALLAHLDARQVDTGANCTLWLTDDPAVFSDAKEIEGVKIVSPVQLYLDLRNLPGRGEEVAHDILKKELPTLLPVPDCPHKQQPGG